jgi:hypothetical protein
MKTFVTKAVVTVASFSLMASVFAPVASAKTKVKVSGNGRNSTNKVAVLSLNASVLLQKNSTTAITGITSTGNTGNNIIKNVTTGTDESGDPSIKSGDVTQASDVAVSGGSNMGISNPCPCMDPTTKVEVSGNGPSSENSVLVASADVSLNAQKNTTFVMTDVVSTGRTGGNTIQGITGAGEVSVDTGDVDQTTTVTVEGSVNAIGGESLIP